ncbi:unnamed protein product, partial [Discosporangium mesarthrocarpum]
MRRTPSRPGGSGKKSSGSGFKIIYSVSKLLSMGKAEQLRQTERGEKVKKGGNEENGTKVEKDLEEVKSEAEEAGVGEGAGKENKSGEADEDLAEGWQKYGYNKIIPLMPEEGSRMPAPNITEEVLATLNLRPGSARDFHAKHLKHLASLAEAGMGNGDAITGPRGGRGHLGMGVARGERGLDRGRGDRDRGLQGRFEGGDRDNDRSGGTARPGAVGPPRGPSRWDALRPERDRDRGYNNRNIRERDVDG